MMREIFPSLIFSGAAIFSLLITEIIEKDIERETDEMKSIYAAYMKEEHTERRDER